VSSITLACTEEEWGFSEARVPVAAEGGKSERGASLEKFGGKRTTKVANKDDSIAPRHDCAVDCNKLSQSLSGSSNGDCRSGRSIAKHEGDKGLRRRKGACFTGSQPAALFATSSDRKHPGSKKLRLLLVAMVDPKNDAEGGVSFCSTCLDNKKAR